MGAVKDYFTKEYITALNQFQIQFKTMLQNGYSGTRKSRAKGSSLEFSDFRPYVMGDDLRRIDWNSYGRLDRLFIKQFMEEKQANFHIILDTSKSMEYGNPTKGMYAKVLAGSLGYIGFNNMDRVNIYAYGDHIAAQQLNLQSKNQFSNLIVFLDELKAEEKTSLNQTLHQISRRKLEPGVSIVISDFFSQDGYEEGLKALQQKKQEVRMIQMITEEEINPTYMGNIRIVDMETKDHKDMDISKDVVASYKKEFEQYEKQIKLFAEKNGMMFKRFTTNQSIFQILKESVSL